MDVAKVRNKVTGGRKKAEKGRKCDGSRIKNEERERETANEQKTRREKEREGEETGSQGNTRAMRRDRMR